MNNNERFFKLYNLDKNGLLNDLKKECICGKELNSSEKTCPDCGNDLSKNKLLNINKKTHLAKRYEIENIKNKYYKFEQKVLLSKDWDLYEISLCNFEISLDLITGKSGYNYGYDINVKNSNSKQFKTMANSKEFLKFLNNNFPNFKEYCENCLKLMQYEYAKSNFYSLSESEISNFLNVWINYNELKDYLLGYKVFHYGKNINLKRYFPETNFNDKADVLKTEICLELLNTWDLKNIKYIEKIIEISKNSDVCDEIIEVYEYFNKQKNINYDNILNVFALIYDNKIDTKDFIRLFKSNKDVFLNILEYEKLKKYYNGKFNWNDIKNLNDFYILLKKDKLKNINATYENKNCLSKKEIEQFYENLEISPLDSFLNL